jgi:hypothetical protein
MMTASKKGEITEDEAKDFSTMAIGGMTFDDGSIKILCHSHIRGSYADGPCQQGLIGKNIEGPKDSHGKFSPRSLKEWPRRKARAMWNTTGRAGLQQPLSSENSLRQII